MEARHPFVVTLDADTLFTPATIGCLLEPLSDARVGAVAGNLKVGNQRNLLTALQSLDYLLTLNLERRAFALLHSVPITPGAISAWRRAAVLEAGGFTRDTVAEDSDMALALGRAGYRTVYAPRAVGFTEAPQTVRGLVTQRGRWSFGTLQCLWKHREATLDPRAKGMGMVVLPSMWIAQVVVPPLSLGIWLTLMISPLTPWLPQFVVVAAAYNAVLAVVTGWALRVEHEPLRRLWLVLPFNLAYRPLTEAIALKALWLAARGAPVGWGRVPRAPGPGAQPRAPRRVRRRRPDRAPSAGLPPSSAPGPRSR